MSKFRSLAESEFIYSMRSFSFSQKLLFILIKLVRHILLSFLYCFHFIKEVLIDKIVKTLIL